MAISFRFPLALIGHSVAVPASEARLTQKQDAHSALAVRAQEPAPTTAIVGLGLIKQDRLSPTFVTHNNAVFINLKRRRQHQLVASKPVHP
jgi:hypothetical protein